MRKGLEDLIEEVKSGVGLPEKAPGAEPLESAKKK